jgi:hypothetical protein
VVPYQAGVEDLLGAGYDETGPVERRTLGLTEVAMVLLAAATGQMVVDMGMTTVTTELDAEPVTVLIEVL